MMTTHAIGTRKEWLTARLELLEAEKELTRRGDEVARRRQELPWVRVDKEYRFDTDEGSASLADLFKGRINHLSHVLPAYSTHPKPERHVGGNRSLKEICVLHEERHASP